MNQSSTGSLTEDQANSQAAEVSEQPAEDDREQILVEQIAPPEDAPPTDAEIYARLCHPFKTTRTDPRGFTYIDGEQCTQRLNQVLGVSGWSFKVLTEKYDEEADEIVVLGELQAEIEGKTVVRQQYGSQKHNRAKATCIWSADDGPQTGVLCGGKDNDHKGWEGKQPRIADHRFVEGPRGAILDSGFDHMGAATTAMKKCASLIGVGLYLRTGGAARSAPQQAQRPQAAAPKSQPARPPARPQTSPATQSTPPAKTPAPITPFRQRAAQPAADATSSPSTAATDGIQALPGTHFVCEVDGKILTEQKLTGNRGTWSAADLAAHGKHNFGKILCAGDYKKAAEARAVAEQDAAAEAAARQEAELERSRQVPPPEAAG